MDQSKNFCEKFQWKVFTLSSSKAYLPTFSDDSL